MMTATMAARRSWRRATSVSIARLAVTRRASTNAFVRLVPVSSRGTPGTGLSSVFGSGGGGGRIAIAFVGADCSVLLTVALSGPVTAPIGTRTLRRFELPGA